MVDTNNKEHEKFTDLAYPWKKTSLSPPTVVIMDPAMTKVYGSYNPYYPDFSKRFDEKEYREIYRNAIKAHKEDVSDGKIINPKDRAAQVVGLEVSPVSIVKTFDKAQFEDWTSSAGSRISAKLISATLETATFLDRNGREIQLKLDQLNEESANRVKERL